MEVLPTLMRNCNETLVSTEKYLTEFGSAESSGNFDVPIKNMCEKIPIVELCMSDIGDFHAVCLEPEEKEAFEIDHNIIVSGIRFACHNGGDRSIRYLADGGRECIRSKHAELQVCLDENVAGFFSTASGGLFDLTNHPLMNQLPEKCSRAVIFAHNPDQNQMYSLVTEMRDIKSLESLKLKYFSNRNLEKFKNCTVSALKTCPLPTAANFFEALFTTVMEVTPCGTPTMTGITARSDVGVEEPVTNTLDEQNEAAEAQVRAANTRQKRAAFAQEHAAEIVEQVAQTWLRNFAN